MSIIHRADREELGDTSIYELYTMLGERDTAWLFNETYRIDTDHDIPTGAGNSMDRKTVYYDRTLYQEVMDNAFKATGLTPQQIVGRHLDHEHVEKTIIDGDNPADTYYPGHTRALRREHEGVIAILCPPSPKEIRKVIERYESTIWPALLRCYHRDPVKVPKDYWCAPLLDEPTERDEELLTILRRLGVYDADKRSKISTHYSIGPPNCESCVNWNPKFISQQDGGLAACHRVGGLVRNNRTCDLWRSIDKITKAAI